MDLGEELRRDLLSRLARIEGQTRGVRRMVEEGRDCADVVQQITAMRAALGKVAAAIVADNLEECLRRRDAAGGPESVQKAKRVLLDLVH